MREKWRKLVQFPLPCSMPPLLLHKARFFWQPCFILPLSAASLYMSRGCYTCNKVGIMVPVDHLSSDAKRGNCVDDGESHVYGSDNELPKGIDHHIIIKYEEQCCGRSEDSKIWRLSDLVFSRGHLHLRLCVPDCGRDGILSILKCYPLSKLWAKVCRTQALTFIYVTRGHKTLVVGPAGCWLALTRLMFKVFRHISTRWLVFICRDHIS